MDQTSHMRSKGTHPSNQLGFAHGKPVGLIEFRLEIGCPKTSY